MIAKNFSMLNYKTPIIISEVLENRSYYNEEVESITMNQKGKNNYESIREKIYNSISLFFFLSLKNDLKTLDNYIANMLFFKKDVDKSSLVGV